MSLRQKHSRSTLCFNLKASNYMFARLLLKKLQIRVGEQ